MGTGQICLKILLHKGTLVHEGSFLKAVKKKLIKNINNIIKMYTKKYQPRARVTQTVKDNYNNK